MNINSELTSEARIEPPIHELNLLSIGVLLEISFRRMLYEKIKTIKKQTKNEEISQ